MTDTETRVINKLKERDAEEHERRKERLRKVAEDVVKQAAACGVVLTIEQVNKQPPAMGNYETVVSVRSMRRS